ncbi:RNA polymerase sigma factor [Nubsella zeaxanthinifaciens]|jgi:RNA polymerase sigma-70 factor (family 1)|uniref:RNA polymerase sigma factor n=1 Tax=Nubsella zeaxanthinifaciens TaxID=392412 RepID=UPI000DE4FA60|nr:RNA polymerase sigma-70 factor [Nubsella zeaxanthinifaciens]
MLSYSSFSDVELLELLKSEDTAAYTVIYNRYFHPLFIHALQKLNDKEEAQDIVHELFAQLWNKRSDIQIHTNLAAYLYSSIRNKILDHISKKQVRDKYVDSLQGFLNSDYNITDHRIREKQLAALIEKGIGQLPSKMREIFELSRKKSLSHKQIAAQLNLSEQTVKKQVNNALRILRTKLGTMLFLVV